MEKTIKHCNQCTMGFRIGRPSDTYAIKDKTRCPQCGLSFHCQNWKPTPGTKHVVVWIDEESGGKLNDGAWVPFFKRLPPHG